MGGAGVSMAGFDCARYFKSLARTKNKGRRMKQNTIRNFDDNPPPFPTFKSLLYTKKEEFFEKTIA